MNWYKFFDHFGILVFLILIVDSMFYLISGVSDWRVYMRLLIGVGGLLIDGYLVFIHKGGGNEKGN